MGFPIIFSRTDLYGCPVAKFIRDLDPKQQDKVVTIFKRVQNLDLVPQKILKKIAGRDNLWEVRVSASSKAFRFFGFLHKGDLVLVHAIVKKTQKTPLRDLEQAERAKGRHFQNHGYL